MREALVELVHRIAARGWSPGTGGNYSYVESRDPLRVVVSPSGINKGELSPDALLTVDESGTVVAGEGRPSAETLLHVAIAKGWGAEVIVHTHSIWNTLASLREGQEFPIAGYEMLKALEEHKTHEAVEVIPIVDNSQDMVSLGGDFLKLANQYPQTHGVLIRGHGLYTWGANMHQAQRHLETLEFLFEIELRRSGASAS